LELPAPIADKQKKKKPQPTLAQFFLNAGTGELSNGVGLGYWGELEIKLNRNSAKARELRAWQEPVLQRTVAVRFPKH
jgi:hypothetical protein